MINQSNDPMTTAAPQQPAIPPSKQYARISASIDGVWGPLSKYDAVLLVGSVAEGLSNDTSDIDLLILGNEVPGAGERFDGDDGVTSVCVNLDDGTLLDAQCIPPPVLADLGKRYSECLRMLDCKSSADAPSSFRLMSQSDQFLLHRLRRSVPLAGVAELAALRERLRLELLPNYLFQSCLSRFFSRRQDIGPQTEANAHTALLMIQEAAAAVAGACLASVGESNPNLKWRIRLLDRHRAEIGAQRVDQLIELMLLGARSDPRSSLESLDRAVREFLEFVLPRRPELAATGAYWVERLGWSRFK